MTDLYKFRYTATIEIECGAELYPKGVDPLEIEKGNAATLLRYALDEHEATIDVIRVR